MPTRFLSRALKIGALTCALAFLASCSVHDTGSSSGTDTHAVSVGEALVAATLTQDAAEATRLIAAGADVDFKDSSGRPVLVLATRANAVDIAKSLILAGADVNAQDGQQDSAYLYAGAEGLNEILKLTLEHGADVASTNRYGGTALIPAAEHGYVHTVKILLETDIDVNHVNNLGWTALLEAVILGSGGQDHQEVIRLLIEAGADLNLPDAQGVSALEHAQQKRQSAVAELLEEAGARR